MFDFLDKDNDGAILDDGARAGTKLLGGGLSLLGGLETTVGTALFGAGLAADATGVGAIAGIPLNALGLATLGVGTATLGAGQVLGTDTAGDIAEEVGDFTSDLFGTRGDKPVADEKIKDDFYRNVEAGNRDQGLGADLNDWIGSIDNVATAVAGGLATSMETTPQAYDVTAGGNTVNINTGPSAQPVSALSPVTQPALPSSSDTAGAS